MSSNRPEKIADLLKREVSKILNQEVKDPRLQNINITAVKVTDDIGIAYIFYTIIGKSIKKDESKIDNEILSKLSGMIRSKLSKIMEIRRVPKIKGVKEILYPGQNKQKRFKKNVNKKIYISENIKNDLESLIAS